MDKGKQHSLLLKGEVVEIMQGPNAIKTRVICKPGSLVFELENANHLLLGEEVLLSGKFVCETVEKLKFNY